MLRVFDKFKLLLGIVSLFAAAAPASAQISQTSAPGVYGAPYRNNIAFDPINEVYLVIVQRPPVVGRFLNRDGVQIGSDFRIALEPNDPFTAWVSVAFGGPPNDPTFLVTYTIADLNLNPKFGRLVRYVPGGSAAVGPANFITNVGSEWLFSEKASNVWNGEKFIVGSRVIQPGGSLPTPQVNLLDLNGAVSGPVYLGDGADYYGSPAIACSAGGICLTIGFKSGIATGYSGGTYGRLFDGITLTPQTGLLSLESGRPNEDHGVVYVAHTGLFLAEWFRGGGEGFIDTRLIAPDGSMSAIDYSRGIGPGAGGNSLAYNARTRTSLLTTKLGAADLVVLELGDDGYPVNPANSLLITPWDGQVLDYLPSNAADANNARWLVSYELQAGGLGKLIQGTAVTGGGGPIPISILTGATLPAAMQNVAYNQFLIGNGSTLPYAWSFESGSLPPGMSLNGSSLTGVLTVPGAYSFSLRLTGGDGQSAVRNFTLQVLQTISVGPGPEGTHISLLATEGLGSGHAYRNNVAYDPVNQVYLVITQRPPVMGRFLNRDGVQIGSDFRIALEPNDPFTAWASVGFGGPPNDPTFLVTYTIADGALNPKYGRLVRYVPGGTASVSNASFITNVGSEWLFSEKAQNVWNGAQFIVGSRVMPGGASLPTPQVNLFSMDGVVSGPIILGDGLDYYGSPAIACAANGTCLTVGFKAGIATGFSGGTYGRRFNGGSLAPIGDMFSVAAGLPNEDQGVVYQSHTDRFLAAWFRGGGAGFIDTRLIGTDGTMSVLDLSKGLGPGAGCNTLVYNPGTHTTLLTTKGTSAELLVFELGDNGYPVNPSNAVLLTPWDGAVLDYLPSAAADGASARWLVTFELQASGYKSLIQGTPLGGGPSCSVSLAPTASGTFATAGGSGNFAVTAACPWSAAPGAAWIHTTSTGAGNGTVNFTVDANSAAARSTTITVAGQVYTVSQAGGAQPAQVVYPGSGSTLAGSGSTFQWSAGTAVAEYVLHVGSAVGGNDLFNSGAVTSLTAFVGNLPTDGRTLYVRLYSLINGNWQPTDSTLTAYTAPAPVFVNAQLLYPASSSTLAGSGSTFQWSTGTGVTQYVLHVGSAFAGNDLFNSGAVTSLTTFVGNLPTDGRTLYVRLYSLINGNWQPVDYTMTAYTAPAPVFVNAQLVYPAAGSTLGGSGSTFQWSTGTGVTQYVLHVGSAFAGNDLFDSGAVTSLTTFVGNLPTDGRTLYVRLYSLINGNWQPVDYTMTAFTAAAPVGVPAQVVYPAPGSTLAGSGSTFQWSTGTGVAQYVLHVGSAFAGNDLFDSGAVTSLTAFVGGLPTDGRTLYVRLYSLINGSWQSNDYTFTAFTAAAPMGVKAEVVYPAPGSTLPGSGATFQWSAGTGVAQYVLHVGSAFAGNDLFDSGAVTSLTAFVGGLPTDGRTLYVRLYSLINGSWQSNDYTMTATSGSAPR